MKTSHIHVGIHPTRPGESIASDSTGSLTKDSRLAKRICSAAALGRGWAVALCVLMSAACSVGDSESDVEDPVEDHESLSSGEALQVSGHYLKGKSSGKPTFLLADTAWNLFSKGTRAQIVDYLEQRKDQGFNTVTVSLGWAANAQGDKPWKTREDVRPDVKKLNTTSGSSSSNATEYDYWDHLRYGLQQARDRGFQIVFVVGGGEVWTYTGASGGRFIETAALGYAYGRNIASQIKGFKNNLIFSVMDDRAPVYGNSDKRAIYRAIAEGFADGVNGVNSFNQSADYSTTIMTALPRKDDPSTSNWFHNDAWLDVNSTQAWPDKGRERVLSDFGKAPTKPTWVLEGRYENYTSDWTAWSQRYQLYHATFAGAFGAVYGETTVCVLDPGWQSQMDAPGAKQAGHLMKLMSQWSDAAYASRVPDQGLLVAAGSVKHKQVGGDFQSATRTSDGKMAMVYAMNGRSIELRMAELAGPKMRAYWFNPRNGKWNNNGSEALSRSEGTAFATVPSGAGADVHTFDPPGSAGNENDWVLVLETASASSPPPPSGASTLLLHWKFNESSGSSAADASGNGHSGLLKNGPTFLLGKYGNGLKFDGVNDQVVGPNLGDSGDRRTVTAWAKASSCAHDECYIVTKSQYTGSTPFTLALWSGGPSFYVNGTEATTPMNAFDGQWHHYAGVLDGSSITLYVDGVAKATKANVNVISNASPVSVGGPASSPSFRSFEGQIDDVRIFDRALTSTQILAVRNNN